jgi:hypothetical protein
MFPDMWILRSDPRSKKSWNIIDLDLNTIWKYFILDLNLYGLKS